MLQPDVYNRCVHFMLRLFGVVSVCFLFSPYRADGQVGQSVALAKGFGFVVPHRPELRNLVTGHSNSWHAGWQMNTRHAGHRKAWHRAYHYPLWGVEVYYADLGNRKQLGQQLAVHAMVKLPQFTRLIAPHRRVQLYSQWGIGAGYSDVVWDLEANPKGIALSSALNVCLSAGYLAQVRVSDRFAVHAGISVVHFSNGSLSVPNLGTNNLSGALGLVYHLTKMRSEASNPDAHVDTSLHSFTKWTFFTAFSSGLRENLPPGGPSHFVHNLVLGAEYRWIFKTALVVRHDASYNLSLDPLLRRNGTTEVQSTDRLQGGFAVGIVRHFGRASFEASMGAYYRNRNAGDGTFYNRFALRHQVTQGISVSLGLKTHWAKADYPEVGVMYRW